MSALSARDRRILWFFGFVLLPLFVVAYGARPALSRWNEARDRRAQQEELLARERALVAVADDLSIPLAEAQSALTVEERGVMRASTPQTAYSALADHLRTLARRDQVLVQQLAELPGDSIGGGLRVVRVNLRGESDLAGVGRFLRSVAADPRRIRVGRLLIERGPQVRSGGGVGTSDGRNVLVLNVVVETLVRVEAAQAGGR